MLTTGAGGEQRPDEGPPHRALGTSTLLAVENDSAYAVCVCFMFERERACVNVLERERESVCVCVCVRV
jgi:hypothetical protein